MKFEKASVKIIDLGEEEILTCRSGCNTICSDYEVSGSTGGTTGYGFGFGYGPGFGTGHHKPKCGWLFKAVFG